MFQGIAADMPLTKAVS